MQEIIINSLIRVLEVLYKKGLFQEEATQKESQGKESTDNTSSTDPLKNSLKNKRIDVRTIPPNINGDYSTNLILTHSKNAKVPPAELAKIVISELLKESWCDKAEFVKPGFINLYCGQSNLVIKHILEQKEQFGAGLVNNQVNSTKGNSEDLALQSRKILIEYVSANPTGPLHTGHGRAAALGSSLSKILQFIGHEVDTEFYLNDAGRQMNILTATFLWRVLQQHKIIDIPLPTNMYQGDYVSQMVAKWLETEATNDSGGGLSNDILAPVGNSLQEIINTQVAEDAESSDALEKQLDEVIGVFRQELADDFNQVKDYVLRQMVDSVKQDLLGFGVEFTNWYYESSSSQSGADLKMLAKLKENGSAYEKEGALWFNSSKFGDDKDRVLIRNNGELTYFGSDIAYHHDKYERGYDVIIDMLGADHHGYVNRIISSMDALGHDPQKMKVLLLQMVFLIDKGNKLSMSTRAGKFQELRDLVAQVGVDATRFFYLMYKSDREINFDVELALSQSKENPVYYVQYAHARICRIFDELGKSDLDKSAGIASAHWDSLRAAGIESLDNLTDAKEKELILRLNEFIPVLQNIGSNYEVHTLVTYLRELAGEFHSYYNSVRVLEEGPQTPPRLCLCEAVGIIINTGLSLIGVNSPEKM
ncbi:MAG: arginine--tRNA ligase [Gammaproteobacteria bacterium]|nr:arginine--tRNA ligase [Gammaproteobacteria bacterium]